MSRLLAAETNDSPLLEPLRRASPEDVLLAVLIQFIAIIAAARLFGWLFRKLGTPSVVGEIAAGLILGPSVLGHFFPEVSRAIFQPGLPGVDPALADLTLHWIFATLSQLGLILLLFLVGLEFDFAHLKGRGTSSLAISLAGLAVPFALGLVLAVPLLPHLEPHPAAPTAAIPPLGFALFLGTALSITAIPVLGRIMMELNITRTRLGSITISAAAAEDAVGWILLAGVAALVRGNFEPLATAWMFGETIAFALVLIVLARRCCTAGLAARWLAEAGAWGRLTWRYCCVCCLARQ